MTKTKLTFIGLAVALVAWVGASAASAQGGPSISLDPASAAEAGEVEVTVTGSGWSVASANVLTCNIAEDANAAEIDPNENCTLASGNLNLAAMTPASVTDGGFEVTITVDVPAQGIFVVAGDSAQTEAASALLAVGMADDMGDDMADDMLADTGSNTPLLAIVALAVVLAGAMVLGLSRRLRVQ